jgi:hypothetical protein
MPPLLLRTTLKTAALRQQATCLLIFFLICRVDIKKRKKRKEKHYKELIFFITKTLACLLVRANFGLYLMVSKRKNNLNQDSIIARSSVNPASRLLHE